MNSEQQVTQEGDAVVTHQDVEPVMGDQENPINLSSVKKEPRKRRVLHFSDGVVEEFSDEEEYQVDSAPAKIQSPPVDPKSLTWGPWLAYKTVAVGSSMLKVCDYLGESLANLFGITTPKYEYEIEEYNRTMKKEHEQKQKEDLEMGGWREPNAVDVPNVDGPNKVTDAGQVAAERCDMRVAG